MACSVTVNGRKLPCKDKLGGIKQIWLGQWTDGVWSDVQADGEVDTVEAALTIKNYDMHKNTGSFTQTITASIENGTIWYDQVVSIQLPQYLGTDVAEMRDLLKGRLVCVVQDVNDNYIIVGHTRGAEVSAGTSVTGVAMGDANGWTLELKGQEILPAPLLNITAAKAGTPALTMTTTT